VTSWRAAQVWPLTLLALLLVGPAPGEVGGCGQDPIISEAEDFCRDQGAWECRRAEARGELADDPLQACFDAIPNACVGAAWPPSCLPRPTRLQTDACLDALALEDNARVPLEELSACAEVCPAAAVSEGP
jgi:hypothetical protein